MVRSAKNKNFKQNKKKYNVFRFLGISLFMIFSFFSLPTVNDFLVKNLNFKKSIISNAGVNFDQELEKRKKVLGGEIETKTKNLNLKRMQDIAIESSEQCERITIPEVCAVKKLKDLIPNWDNDRIIFFCDETIRNNDAVKIDFQNLSTKSFGAILVGPEGGFSANETNYLREKNFIRPIDLGPRILRSDTAVITALSFWHFLNGDIKNN